MASIEKVSKVDSSRSGGNSSRTDDNWDSLINRLPVHEDLKRAVFPAIHRASPYLPDLVFSWLKDTALRLTLLKFVTSVEQRYEIIKDLEKEQILRAYRDDPWLRNYYLNIWEYETGQTVLESYPWNVSLPLADVCNARCTFCNSWLRGTKVLKPDELARFEPVLKYASLLGIQGHGEPLANPHVDEILKILSKKLDPRCRAYIITNGVFVQRKLDLLLAAQVKAYNYSLNGASAGSHHAVMGLGEDAFDKVMESIYLLIAKRDKEQLPIEVNISMVLTKENIHEAGEFVRMGNRLGVNKVYLRTLMPTVQVSPGLNYHLIPPYLHPDFQKFVDECKEEISKSEVLIEAYPDTWKNPVITENYYDQPGHELPKFISRKEALNSKEIRGYYREEGMKINGLGEFNPQKNMQHYEDFINPYNRTPHFHCRFVYHNLICNELNFRIVPCCYMADVPEHDPVIYDGSHDFFDYWNSPAFVELRRRLKDGPLYGPCLTCPMQG